MVCKLYLKIDVREKKHDVRHAPWHQPMISSSIGVPGLCAVRNLTNLTRFQK